MDREELLDAGVEQGEHDEGKYAESEMQEFAQASRAEGIEAGIRMGMARVSNGSGNGHPTLPSPVGVMRTRRPSRNIK